MPATAGEAAAAAAAAGADAQLAPSKAYAAALDGARRRARSHSPVRHHHSVDDAAAGARPRPSANLADEFSKWLQLQRGAAGQAAGESADSIAAAVVQRLSQRLLAAAEPARPDTNGAAAAGLQAAAAAVVSQLKALGAPQGGFRAHAINNISVLPPSHPKFGLVSKPKCAVY